MSIVPSLRHFTMTGLCALTCTTPLAALDQAFEIHDFAAPPQVSWPVSLAAAANGDVYVSSDQNGSLGKAKGMGKIVRLRDTDNDGKADQFINFVPDVDSPRGGHLVGDTFYLIHPPYMSSFRDTNGDGISDEQKQLVVGFGGGIEHPRGADHTTNGLRMGIDGWIYVAVGDFGMADAKGADGTRYTMYGGGVARVRPDGSELEGYALMVRNIYDVAISPELDIFSRDNTNDGKGWNTRFHHFTNLGDHGYPRLYQNFANEAISPLNDFGGGSGTGGLWIHEPGFPKDFGNTLLTCDWTTGNIYHNPVTREFSSYSVKQDVFLKLPRATDIDVDGFSRLYIADWRNGGFNHAKDGKPVGVIQQITCPTEKPAQYVEVTKSSNEELVSLITSRSGVQRLEAQWEIVKRGTTGAEETKRNNRDALGKGLLISVKNKDYPGYARIAALFTYKQLLGKDSTPAFIELVQDAEMREYALRAMADRKSQLADVPVAVFTAALTDKNPRVVLQALIGLQRLDDKTSASAILAASTTWKDGGVSPRLQHTAVTTLVSLANADVLLSSVKDLSTRSIALQSLQRLHRPDVVTGLISIADSTKDESLHYDVLGALARLSFQEKPWDLKAWWSTRPDDRGPYFETLAWESTPSITAALENGFSKIPKSRQGEYLDTLAKNRIPVTELKLPGLDPVLACIGLSKLDDKQANILVEAAKDSKRDPAQRTTIYKALSRAEDNISTAARIKVLGSWSNDKNAPAVTAQFTDDFINETQRGTELKELNKIANQGDDDVSRIAWMSILTVINSPLAKDKWKEEAQKLVNDNPRNVGFFRAITDMKLTGYDKQIAAGLASDNRKVIDAATTAKAATVSVGSSGKKVAELPAKEVFDAAMKNKGNSEIGKRIFTTQGCVACHATDLKAEQKGPFLGAAGAKFTRDYLIDSIMDPNKVVAQGFQTLIFTMNDGSVQSGFVTNEADGVIELRNIVGQVSKIKRADVKKEDRLPTSMMPPGLANPLSVEDFTSLVEYMTTLKAQGG